MIPTPFDPRSVLSDVAPAFWVGDKSETLSGDGAKAGAGGYCLIGVGIGVDAVQEAVTATVARIAIAITVRRRR